MRGTRAKLIKRQVNEAHGHLPWENYVKGNDGERVNAGRGRAYRKAKQFYKKLRSI